MLRKFSFSNAYSCRDLVEVDLTVDRREPPSNWWAEDKDRSRVAKCMAVIGANASGKTSLFNGLAFMHWFLSNSFALHPEAPLLFRPHADASNEPSMFSAEFVTHADGFEFVLRYTVQVTQTMVLHELLERKTERWSRVDERTWVDATRTYDYKHSGFGEIPENALNGRRNASAASIGAQYGLGSAKGLASLRFRTNLNEIGKRHWQSEDLTQAAAVMGGDNEPDQE